MATDFTFCVHHSALRLQVCVRTTKHVSSVACTCRRYMSPILACQPNKCQPASWQPEGQQAIGASFYCVVQDGEPTLIGHRDGGSRGQMCSEVKNGMHATHSEGSFLGRMQQGLQPLAVKAVGFPEVVDV